MKDLSLSAGPRSARRRRRASTRPRSRSGTSRRSACCSATTAATASSRPSRSCRSWPRRSPTLRSSRPRSRGRTWRCTDFTKDRAWARSGDRGERRRAFARSRSRRGGRHDRRDPPRDGPGEGGRGALSPRARGAAGRRRARSSASAEPRKRPATPRRRRRRSGAPSLLEPSFAVFNQLAALYFDLGRYGEAAEVFRTASQTAPDSYGALSNLGGAETMRCEFSGGARGFSQGARRSTRRTATPRRTSG